MTLELSRIWKLGIYAYDINYAEEKMAEEIVSYVDNINKDPCMIINSGCHASLAGMGKINSLSWEQCFKMAHAYPPYPPTVIIYPKPPVKIIYQNMYMFFVPLCQHPYVISGGMSSNNAISPDDAE